MMSNASPTITTLLLFERARVAKSLYVVRNAHKVPTMAQIEKAVSDSYYLLSGAH